MIDGFNSSNGTFVNGKKLGKGIKIRLKNEDVISLLPKSEKKKAESMITASPPSHKLRIVTQIVDISWQFFDLTERLSSKPHIHLGRSDNLFSPEGKRKLEELKKEKSRADDPK